MLLEGVDVVEIVVVSVTLVLTLSYGNGVDDTDKDVVAVTVELPHAEVAAEAHADLLREREGEPDALCAADGVVLPDADTQAEGDTLVLEETLSENVPLTLKVVLTLMQSLLLPVSIGDALPNIVIDGVKETDPQGVELVDDDDDDEGRNVSLDEAEGITVDVAH